MRIKAVRTLEGDLETLDPCVPRGQQEVLQGVVPLVKVLLAPGEMGLAEWPTITSFRATSKANGRKVAELFDNKATEDLSRRFGGLWTKEKKLAGVIYAEQVIAQLRTIALR